MSTLTAICLDQCGSTCSGRRDQLHHCACHPLKQTKINPVPPSVTCAETVQLCFPPTGAHPRMAPQVLGFTQRKLAGRRGTRERPSISLGWELAPALEKQDIITAHTTEERYDAAIFCSQKSNRTSTNSQGKCTLSLLATTQVCYVFCVSFTETRTRLKHAYSKASWLLG